MALSTYAFSMETIKELMRLVEKYSNTPVIAEGIKDRKALQQLGFKRVYTLKKSLPAAVEEFIGLLDKNNECLILTDLDREGKKLYSKLNSELSQKGAKINNELRHFLYKYTKLRQIEGIINYIRRYVESSFAADKTF